MKHPVHLSLGKQIQKTVQIEEKTSLLEALKGKGYSLRSSCGGHASCSDCLIKVLSGEDNLNSPSFAEIQLLGNVFHITKERLACQTTLLGEVALDISSHSDDEQRKPKSRPFIKVRKKEEYQKIRQEQQRKNEEKGEEKEKWRHHWKKDKEARGPKRLGGGRRPRAFQITVEERERPDFQKEREKKKKEF